MKTINFFTVLATFCLFISCKKEMKISRANQTVLKEIHDFSPVYINNENKQAISNRNNIIGNTHWILSIDRELSLGAITKELQYLTNKKYKGDSAHEDTKKIYIVYSDTLNKNNAFVPFHFKNIYTTDFKPNQHDEILKINSAKDIEQKIFTRYSIIQLSPDLNIEEFTNILISIKSNNTANSLSDKLIIK